MSTPLILVSNDDGIEAPGLHALVAALLPLGEVMVVAPITEQSAVGHAITIRDPVRAKPWPFKVNGADVEAYAVTGTPADCIKLALNRLVTRRPTLVCSGINNGPNTAVNIMYSGTVSAATEAAILGIDSIAFSQSAWAKRDFAESARWSARIAAHVLKTGVPPGVLLNVNLPYEVEGGIRGVRITRQARSRWDERFDSRLDPYDQPYYWLTGQFVNLDQGAPDTDLAAIDDGFVSITPIHFDLTAYAWLDELRTWDIPPPQTP